MPNTELSKPTVLLVVDDDIEILSLLTRALNNYGFEVLTADDGVKAVETFLRHHDRINLVLLDVEMPTWDERKILLELQRIDPSVPVAFMSATPRQFSSAELLGLGVIKIFDKPFLSLKYLAETVKEIVEKK
jgi:DNA-binding response OmpR family regulator